MQKTLILQDNYGLVRSKITEVISVAGVDLVGPLPPELNNITVNAAGVGTGSQQAEAANALIKFLHTPEAQAVFKAKGLKPADAPKGT